MRMVESEEHLAYCILVILLCGANLKNVYEGFGMMYK